MTELEKLRNALNPSQLKFADLYLENYDKVASKAVKLADVYSKAFPGSKSPEVAYKCAYRLLHDTGPCMDYVNFVLNESGREKTNKQIADLGELQEYMTRNMRGIDELFNDILCSRLYKISKDGEPEAHVSGLFVDDTDDIPPAMLKYVESVRYIDNVGWLVKTKLSQADKDRNKCAEMLTRMQGGFVDKVEMSGPGGGAIEVTFSGEVKLEIQNILANL